MEPLCLALCVRVAIVVESAIEIQFKNFKSCRMQNTMRLLTVWLGARRLKHISWSWNVSGRVSTLSHKPFSLREQVSIKSLSDFGKACYELWIKWSTGFSVTYYVIDHKPIIIYLCRRCSTAESRMEPCSKNSWFGTMWLFTACDKQSTADCIGAFISSIMYVCTWLQQIE